ARALRAARPVPPSPPGRSSDLLRRVAGEQEAAEQRARLVRRQPGGALRDLDDGGRRARRPGVDVELLGVLGEHPDLDVVAAAELDRKSTRLKSSQVKTSYARCW